MSPPFLDQELRELADVGINCGEAGWSGGLQVHPGRQAGVQHALVHLTKSDVPGVFRAVNLQHQVIRGHALFQSSADTLHHLPPEVPHVLMFSLPLLLLAVLAGSSVSV